VQIRTLLVAPSPAALEGLSRQVRIPDGKLVLSTHTGGVTDLTKALLSGDFDLLVAQFAAISDAELDKIDSALQAQPGASLVLVSSDTSADFLLRAMRAGVREIVPPDAPDELLTKAVLRQMERIGASRGGIAKTKGKVIAFMPAKGGSGASFLVTNLAYALASRGLRVAMLDLNLQFGDVALLMTDKRPPSNIADVARDAHRLDAALLESSMMRVADHLFLLAAPDSPERSVEVKPEVVERIIALARSEFDFVLLDVGRILEAVSIRALDEAETIYLVVQAALPTLHDAKRLISVLAGLGYSNEKIAIVLNRADKRSDIGQDEIRKALGHEVAIQVPNSYENVVYSINHGISILKHSPKDPVARALSEWAERLAPAKEKRGGWLRGVFRGQ
jgi:pilus assembly protein CpaE